MCAVSITDLPSLRFLCTGDTSEHGRIIGDNASGATVRLAIPVTTANRSIATAGETLHTTAHHPWVTADRGWIEAGQLQPGEQVITLTAGSGNTGWAGCTSYLVRTDV